VILIPRKKRAKDNGASQTVKPKRKKRKKRELDINKFAETIFNDISDYLGLKLLGIDQKLQKDIVLEVMNIIITSTSYKPSIETLFKRIKRNRELINMIIAGKILEAIPVKKLTDTQLEFIIYNGARFIISYVSELYKEIKRRGREDLLSYLKYIWEKYGIPAPVECPRCGFRAIMPDYSCYVCGYVVDDRYLRTKIGFEEKFKEYLASASTAELRDVAEIGYVLVSEEGIRSPRYRVERRTLYYPIYLTKKDLSLIDEEISKRKIPV